MADTLIDMGLMALGAVLLAVVADGIYEGLVYETDKRAAYVRNLENTLAKCLTRGDHPIHLEDGTVLLCGAADGGKHAKR